jgi:hypothetical protein
MKKNDSLEIFKAVFESVSTQQILSRNIDNFFVFKTSQNTKICLR